MASKEGSDSDSDIDVTFDFCDPGEDYFHGIRSLLKDYMYTLSVASDLADLVIKQIVVGTILTQEGEDFDVFAFATLINLTRHKENSAIKRLLDLFKTKSNAKQLAVVKNVVGSKKACFLIQRRMVNLPFQLIPALHDNVLKDVGWTVESGETLPEEVEDFSNIEYIFVIAPLHNDDGNGDGSDDDSSSNDESDNSDGDEEDSENEENIPTQNDDEEEEEERKPPNKKANKSESDPKPSKKRNHRSTSSSSPTSKKKRPSTELASNGTAEDASPPKAQSSGKQSRNTNSGLLLNPPEGYVHTYFEYEQLCEVAEVSFPFTEEYEVGSLTMKKAYLCAIIKFERYKEMVQDINSLMPAVAVPISANDGDGDGDGGSKDGSKGGALG